MFVSCRDCNRGKKLFFFSYLILSFFFRYVYFGVTVWYNMLLQTDMNNAITTVWIANKMRRYSNIFFLFCHTEKNEMSRLLPIVSAVLMVHYWWEDESWELIFSDVIWGWIKIQFIFFACSAKFVLLHKLKKDDFSHSQNLHVQWGLNQCSYKHMTTMLMMISCRKAIKKYHHMHKEIFTSKKKSYDTHRMCSELRRHM